MKPKYLNQSWYEITRDERHFCFNLQCQLRQNKTESDFIKWLINESNIELKEEFDGKQFEMDVEVCYYRDLIFQYEKEQGFRIKDKEQIKGFLKRTFDLCIFLPKDIIIIEAKAAKGMTTSQMLEFKKDKKAIEICHSNLNLSKPNVHLIALVSKEYLNKSVWFTNQNEIHGIFENIIDWQKIQDEANCNYSMPEKLNKIYSNTNKIGRFDVFNNDLVQQLINIKNMVRKIEKIKEILKNQCIIKASVFDNNYSEANIPKDSRGSQWNPYVHENCNHYGFEIWKDDKGHNYYVGSSKSCKEEARRENLHLAIL